MEKFAAMGKDVYVYQIPFQRHAFQAPDSVLQQTWKMQWEELKSKLESVYSLNPGTVILDTWTEAYELARLANFGKTEQVMPNRYGPVFAELRATVRLAYEEPRHHHGLHPQDDTQLRHQGAGG